ncbi:MAG: uracil-DNA glycosylase family protein [Pseudomonadota bacterium]
MHTTSQVDRVIRAVRRCSTCSNLPLGPRPILQLNTNAKILIAGQAPGKKTHEKGIPFDDASGQRLREWMGLSRNQFYDKQLVAILPMAFCYPGTGKSGDLPPPPICAETWRRPLLQLLPNIQLTLVIGQYALDWHLAGKQRKTLTQTVGDWKTYWPEVVPMPHPSPRNNRWLKKNPWFAEEVLPSLQHTIAQLTSSPSI